jgi:hypothetical protein
MPIPEDIRDFVEEQINLMISQSKVYLPFIKVAFPYSKNPTDACYNLIVGSAALLFLNQYAVRLQFPTSEEFIEFGKITLKYRDQIEQFLK